MWPAIIAGGAALAGSAMSMMSSSNASGASEYAAKHRYRWAVDDMRRAGLNPVLAATSGGIAGATAPNYQQANYSGMSQAGQSAATVYNASSQRKQVESNMELQNAQTSNQLADIPVKQEQALNYRAQNSNIQSQNELLKQQAITEASRRVLMNAQAGQASASGGYMNQQRVNAQLDGVRKQIEADYYNTEIGAESHRVNLDAKPGGPAGNLNFFLRSMQRDGYGAPTSAKGYQTTPAPLRKPVLSKYQEELRSHYSR